MPLSLSLSLCLSLQDRLSGLRLRQVMGAWLGLAKHEKRLEVMGQYVYTQTVKRLLASHFATWCEGVLEGRHQRNKQQLKKLIKQMQKMLSKSKEKIELVESERDDASKKVGDLVTAVTNLNWKIQYGGSALPQIFPDGQSPAKLSQTAPAALITRK